MGKAVRQTSDRSTHSVLHLVKQVQYKAYVRLEAVLTPLGVTAVQFRILTTLSTRPNMSSAELARLYDVKPQTMIKQIALLEGKGLIGRRVSDANKRLLEVSLTPAGSDTLKQLQKDSRTLERELLSSLGADEQAELRTYLVRLLESLSAVPAAEDKLGQAEEFAPEYRRAGLQRL
jgi:DNA-binding MarR family transcriptional regulator